MNSKFCGVKNAQQVFALHLGTAASCCRAYPETLPSTKTIQQQVIQWQHESELLKQGVELPGCKLCWDDEKQNKVSWRQKVGLKEHSITRIELLFSNLCNQMCSYCSPRYSSVWEKSIAEHGEFERISTTAKQNLSLPVSVDNQLSRLNEISDYIKTLEDNSVMLVLLGGEPLMQINSLQTLLKFAEEKIKVLTIITNLNPPTTKFLDWLVENYPLNKLQFEVSLDATPGYNHVPRAGFDQERFLKNLDLLEQRQIKIKFLSTVSATSIFDLPRFLEWTQQRDITFNTLNNPGCLNPEIVPNQFRADILNQIQVAVPDVIARILNYDQPEVDFKLYEQYNYLTQYFDRTETDIGTVKDSLFANYWKWLTEKFKK